MHIVFRDKHRLCAQREKIQAPSSFAAAVISTLSLLPEETVFLFLGEWHREAYRSIVSFLFPLSPCMLP